MGALTEDELWEHYPTFHVNHPSVVTVRPVLNPGTNRTRRVPRPVLIGHTIRLDIARPPPGGDARLT